LKVLDLFCGAGGLTSGFRKAGYSVTGIDISEYAGETYRINKFGDFRQVDLSLDTVDGDYDVVIGGPPCRPWSPINTRRRGQIHSDYNLVDVFFTHIERIRPLAFILENVPPLASDMKFVSWLAAMKALGYSLQRETVQYSEYGAATRRHRLIVFGWANGKADMFFKRLHRLREKPSTVRDVMWQLRDQEMGTVPDHVWPQLNTIEKYLRYYETGKYGWYVLDWDSPAPSFGNIMKTYILHPDARNGGPKRVISVREALLIMGFGMDFRFPQEAGTGIRYQMIADSVSPVFSLKIAKTLAEVLALNNGRR
jgi:DNA (cytosine-5)-methyltransferase 1